MFAPHTLIAQQPGAERVVQTEWPDDDVEIEIGPSIFETIWKGIQDAYNWIGDKAVEAVEWALEAVAGNPPMEHADSLPDDLLKKCKDPELVLRAQNALRQANSTYDRYKVDYVIANSHIEKMETALRAAVITHKWVSLMFPIVQAANKADDLFEAYKAKQKISNLPLKLVAAKAALGTLEGIHEVGELTELSGQGYDRMFANKKADGKEKAKVDPLEEPKFWNDLFTKSNALLESKTFSNFVDKYREHHSTLIEVAQGAGKFGASLFPAIDAALSTAQELKEIGNSIDQVAQSRKNLKSLESAYQGKVADLKAAIAALKACPAKPDPVESPEGETGEKDRKKKDNAGENDPNDKIGPNAAGVNGFMRPGMLSYEVLFENDPEAGATLSAERVMITDQLDEDLDLSTLEVTGFGFNNFDFEIPAGLSAYQTTVDLRPEGIDLHVPVEFDLDDQTRTLTVNFASLDPLTGLVPDDIDAGFLPVNDKAIHNGEGYIRYRIRPLVGLPTGTEIRNQASIVFGINDPILTPETVHTIDRDAPNSTVAALAEAYGTASFMVEWSGQDDARGSGIHSYDLYVSRDDGPFEKVATHLTETSHEFTGESGSTYGFVSLARDNVGNVEVMPTVADTQTLVIIGAWVNRVDVYDVDNNGKVTARDALVIINEMGRNRVSDPDTFVLTPLPPDGYAPPYYDVTEDGKITALDALRVINQMARISAEAGESSGIANSAMALPEYGTGLSGDRKSDDEVSAFMTDARRTPVLAFTDAPSRNTNSVRGLPVVAQFDADESFGALEATLCTLADDVANQWATPGA